MAKHHDGHTGSIDAGHGLRKKHGNHGHKDGMIHESHHKHNKAHGMPGGSHAPGECYEGGEPAGGGEGAPTAAENEEED